MMLFLSAILLGLVFNAAPGAVFAETVRQGVRGGFRPVLAVQIGALSSARELVQSSRAPVRDVPAVSTKL